MLKRHGSVNSDTKPIERKDEEEEYNLQPDNQSKMQKEEYFIKNACYSVTKSYLCKQNNKRSLLGRKQRSQVARSFPNRYQFSCTNKVTSLFSISCFLDIILQCGRCKKVTRKVQKDCVKGARERDERYKGGCRKVLTEGKREKPPEAIARMASHV